MFCYQCQEAAHNTGCNKSVGVCSKTAEVSDLQDLLLYLLQGVSHLQVEARKEGKDSREISVFILECLFATISRSNYDDRAISKLIYRCIELRNKLLAAIRPGTLPDSASCLSAASSEEELLSKAGEVSILSEENEDLRSLRELLKYSLKGIAAYGDHAAVLGFYDETVFSFAEEALAALNRDLGQDERLSLVLKSGEIAVAVMALLDSANTQTFGNPVPTKVSGSLEEAPGILVSGHDLLDIKELLEQTQGTGIKIYTHSEMLVSHAYPELKKYPHLAGNWGGAWFEQQIDFARFNGPVLFTTNCIVKPLDSYKDRIFTTGNAGWPGWQHIPARKKGQSKDFRAIIDMALSLGNLSPHKGPDMTTGFGRETLLGAKDQIIEAVKAGKIKKFIAMGGCDGNSKDRDYYWEFAEASPSDTLILTAGCAKYRYNRLDLGEIGGIPRVVDAGQCNDNYLLAVLALELQKTLGAASLNELPLAFNISWYEQKAVAVLLGLLHLGVKGIQIGPTLPAFLSPNVAKLLVETFGLRVKGKLQADLTHFFS